MSSVPAVHCAGRRTMPSGTTPSRTSRHKAIRSLRAKATIMVLRVPRAFSVRARITIPEDVRADYHALYEKHVDELFYAPADCPSQRAQVLFSEWQAAIKNRIATLRAKQRGEGHDLTQREARALAGEWYCWYVDQHEENPGEPRRWAKLREILFLLLEDAGGDP